MTAPQSFLLIIGAGSHARVVADAALQQAKWADLVATDRQPALWGSQLLPGIRVIALEETSGLAAQVHVAIGDNAARLAESEAFGARPLVAVVHPHASVSSYATFGPGSFVAAQAVLAPTSQVGRCVIVNHGAVVDHDCRVGDFSHVGPHACIGGGASVGRSVLLGAGSRILPGISVCDAAVIGAGAVVHRPIVVPGTYVGVPARRVA